jgi:hypothetical protein
VSVCVVSVSDVMCNSKNKTTEKKSDDNIVDLEDLPA